MVYHIENFSLQTKEKLTFKKLMRQNAQVKSENKDIIEMYNAKIKKFKETRKKEMKKLKILDKAAKNDELDQYSKWHFHSIN